MAGKPPSVRAEDADKETKFAYELVKDNENAMKVYKMYEKMASVYNNVIDLGTLRLHRVWKNKLMCRLAPTENTKLIDVAGGTGDIAFRFLDYIKKNNIEKNCHVTVCDINASMLAVAQTRSKALNHDPKLISFKQADAENLGYENESFDTYVTGLGLRYFTHLDKALKEAYRVLKPGGRLLCLECSHMEEGFAKWLYEHYFLHILPIIGPFFVYGNRETYQYILEGIRQSPKQEHLKTMMEEAGFQNVTYENLCWGMAAIHSGYKP